MTSSDCYLQQRQRTWFVYVLCVSISFVFVTTTTTTTTKSVHGYIIQFIRVELVDSFLEQNNLLTLLVWNQMSILICQYAMNSIFFRQLIFYSRQNRSTHISHPFIIVWSSLTSTLNIAPKRIVCWAITTPNDNTYFMFHVTCGGVANIACSIFTHAPIGSSSQLCSLPPIN